MNHKSYILNLCLTALLFFLWSGSAHASLTLGKPLNFLTFTSGLVGHWTFDGKDTVWTSATAATTLDKSGNNNTGTLTNMNRATSPAIGKIGQALNFDGVDDYVDAGSDFIGTTAITVSAWVNSNSNFHDQRIINNGSVMFAATNNARYHFRSQGFVGTVAYSATGSRVQNVWQFVVATRDASGITNFYINGVLSGTANQSSGTPTAGTTNVIIGNNSLAAADFSGMIDDVRVYNRTLTSAEIFALYNATSGSKQNATVSNLTDGLVGHWTFDGKDTPWTSATAGTAIDRSGNGNTGTLTNMNRATAPAIGKIGQGLSFDGVDDYVDIPDSSAFDSIEGSSGATVSVWIKRLGASGHYITRVPGFPTGRSFSIKGDVNFDVRNSWYYGGSVSGGTNLDHFCNASTCPVPLNQWTHLVSIYNDPTSYIYINGELKNTKDGTGGVLNTDVSAPIKIGASDTSSVFTNVILDDIRIYSRALSASEIQQLYNLGR